MDKEKFPISDELSDFNARNDDANKMGHIGAYFNAFVSAKLSNFYYGIVHHKADFCPYAVTWVQQGGPKAGTPTHASTKFLFLFSVILLFIERYYYKFIALIMIICSMALPTNMIGYLRYTSFLFMLVCFVPEIINTLDNKILKKTLKCVFIGAIVCYLIQTKTYMMPIHIAQTIDMAYGMKCIITKYPPQSIFTSGGMNGYIFEAELQLMKRMVPSFNDTDIYACDSPIYAQIWNDDKQLTSTGLFFTNDNRYLQDTILQKYNYYHKNPNERIKALPLNIIKIYFITLPKSILMELRYNTYSANKVKPIFGSRNYQGSATSQ